MKETLTIAAFAVFSLSFGVYSMFTPSGSRTKAAASTAPVFTAAPLDNRPEAVSDVVAAAQAFKASLTSSQQGFLQQPYSTSAARRWSNLPCGSACRNGIPFSSLSSSQIALALQVIQAAMGSVPNEGYDEFVQIRLADQYLSANGGGPAYSPGLYFMAFLNEPTSTGSWMLQFGGHHYAANIAYNAGRVVGVTPEFTGVEPVTFTLNGQTHSPMTQERNALAEMLASLTTEQLAAAKLNQTFGDVLMTPGETNGGIGTFPAVKVGLPASNMTAGQRALLIAAIQPYIRDFDAAVANTLNTIYSNEIGGTYVSYTGNGTSDNVSSFLNANTNYVRIDGPSVWIEFSVRTGAVAVNPIHYHSVYRDRTRDYGADLSSTTALDATPTPTPSPTPTPTPAATPTPTPTPNPNISGRVTTPEGSGLRSARVYLVDALGIAQFVTTSSLGFFTFQDVTPGTYTIGVSSKRYRFETRSVQVQNSSIEVNFTGSE